MTVEQEEHLISILASFKTACENKYRAGQAEHGGTLSEYPLENLLDNAIDEAIDQYVYLMTMKQKLQNKYVYPKPNYDADV